MRPDIGKVFDERPRGGGRQDDKGYSREFQRIPIEDCSSRESIKDRCRGGSKWTNDLVGPIARFLLKNVGRPWDLVHSEICRATPGRSRSRERILGQVHRFVERNVLLVDGIPCRGEGPEFGSPLRNYGDRYFYVCPATGLLRRVANRRKTHY